MHDLTDAQKIDEYAHCEADFLYFLTKYIQIQDATTRSVIPFESWPHLLEFAAYLATGGSASVDKSRQIGISWLLAAYAIWVGNFNRAAKVLEFSQGLTEATDLVGKSRFIYDQLPDYIRASLIGDAKGSMQFKNGSEIRALPSTENAGRSVTASVLIYDEHAFHPYAEANYTAAKPTIDAGGQVISVSTNDKRKTMTLFKALYLDAKAKKNQMKAFFFGVWCRPGRDQAWYDKTKRDIPSEALAATGLTPGAFMEQEYPRTEEESLSPSKALAAFDVDALREMEADCRKPIEVVNGVINIYQKWSVGKTYVAFTDTSHGVGQDYGASGVMDVQTGYVVADILSNVLSPEELAYHTVQMLHLYKDPLWGIEDNDWGILTIRKGQEQGYRNFFYREWQKAGKRTPEPVTVGWHTDEKRVLLFGELISGVHDRLVVIPNRQGLSQFYQLIRNPEKGGRIEAAQGAHDDYPLMVGGCWQMRKYVHVGTTVIKPKRYAYA